jgi:hypothetical protein
MATSDRRPRPAWALPALCVGLAGLGGCGGGVSHPRLAVVPTQGKVFYQGKPAVGARIFLLPVNDPSPDAVKPRGTVGDDGTFHLTTYPSAAGKPDGAPPGEYRVRLIWTDPPLSAPIRAAASGEDEPSDPPGGIRRDWFRGRYSNPEKSGLKVTIGDGPTELPVFDLK